MSVSVLKTIPFSFPHSYNIFFCLNEIFSGRFGCKIISNRTGIILNDGMDDFSIPGKKNAYGIPPSPANFIRPQKMPLSSMCPTILLDRDQNVELILGAAGGSKITSSIAYVSESVEVFEHLFND